MDGLWGRRAAFAKKSFMKTCSLVDFLCCPAGTSPAPLESSQSAEVVIPEKVWLRASSALAAGAATLTSSAATAALQQVSIPCSSSPFSLIPTPHVQHGMPHCALVNRICIGLHFIDNNCIMRRSSCHHSSQAGSGKHRRCTVVIAWQGSKGDDGPNGNARGVAYSERMSNGQRRRILMRRVAGVQGSRRSAQKCRERYGMLLAAGRRSANPAAPTMNAVKALQCDLAGLVAAQPVLTAQV